MDDLSHAPSHPDHPPLLPGIDAAGQVWFQRAWLCVTPFLQQHLGIDLATWGDILTPEQRANWQAAWHDLYRRMTQPEAASAVVQAQARARYAALLRPIVVDLELEQRHFALVGQRLLRQRHYRPPAHLATADEAVQWLSDLFFGPLTAKQQRLQLIAANACHDERSADWLLKQLQGAAQQARGAAQGIVLAAIEYGWIGLLQHSAHPCTAEFLLLQRAFDTAPTLTNPQRAALRHALIALKSAFVATTTAQPYGGWAINLLHLPPHDPQRQRYQQQVRDQRTDAIVTQMIAVSGYNLATATTLLDSLLTSGIPAMIATITQRGDGAAQVRHDFEQRLAHAIHATLGALNPPAQAHVAQRMQYLHQAASETGVSLPLIPLLRMHPASLQRIQLGRRIWFGAGASISRAQRSMRRRGKQRWRTERRPRRSGPQPIDALVSRFAELSGEPSLAESRQHIRQLITYGGLGLFPKGEWPALIDPRLRSYLAFIKLGHLDEGVNWETCAERLRTYAESLGIRPLSTQLAKAIFNSIPKPRAWNGGYGEDVAAFRQRRSLFLKAPCLHERWVIWHGRSRRPISLRSENGQLLSHSARIAVIFEEGTQRPVGLWVDADYAPAMALYYALFHPGHPNWPLRGIPQSLALPYKLGEHQKILEQAATHMMSRVEILTPMQQTRQRDSMPKAQQLIDRLYTDGVRYLNHITGSQPVSRQQATDSLIDWLRRENGIAIPGGGCFPNHRTPELSQNHPHILPGYDLPIAGMLLPKSEVIETQRNQIVYRNICYSDNNTLFPPGISGHLHIPPFHYASVPQHVFLSLPTAPLVYLPAQHPL